MKAFLDELADAEVAAIVAGMKEVAERGLVAAKHLRGDIYEVRAEAPSRELPLALLGRGPVRAGAAFTVGLREEDAEDPSAGARARGEAAAGLATAWDGEGPAKLGLAAGP